MSTASPK
nr:unknown [Lotus japonicus]